MAGEFHGFRHAERILCAGDARVEEDPVTAEFHGERNIRGGSDARVDDDGVIWIVGFEVLQALKEDPETAGIKVIVLTNLEGSGDVEKALELGATTYLVKASYELEDVVRKVRDVLGQ